MAHFNDKILQDVGHRLRGLRWPMPSNSLYSSALADPDKVLYRIQQRFLYKCFLLQEGGLFTVYASPGYTRYRGAFKAALGVDVARADIDHYFARAAAERDMKLDALWRAAGVAAASPEGEIFVALGAPPAGVNRSARDGTDPNTMLLKLLGRKSLNPATKRAVAFDFGGRDVAELVLSTGFRAHHGLVRWANVSEVTEGALKGREREVFKAYLDAKRR